MRIVIFILTLFLFSCNQNQREKVSTDVLNEKLTSMNKKMVQSESIEIDDFARRHNFKMKNTGTGLRYEILNVTSGKNPTLHQIVEISYKAFLLDGTLCLQTDSLKHLIIRLGEGNEVTGLEEGVMLMKAGEKARLIVPSHLGYGTSGDGKNIPPLSAIYYNVELIKITE